MPGSRPPPPIPCSTSPCRAGFEGNGYINVQYIRDPSSDEIFMSPLSYGVAPFSVNVDARRNPLTHRRAGAGQAGRDRHVQAACRRARPRRCCSRWTRASCRSRATSWAIR